MGIVANLVREPTPRRGVITLSGVASSHTLRCDAKQARAEYAALDSYLDQTDCFELGECLPEVIVKGEQPDYIESLDPDGTPVISTLAIQNLRVVTDACRFMTREDFDALPKVKIPSTGDLLLTVDGGPSIGKPYVYALDGDFAIDSHVAILRPQGVRPLYLAYLLASPLGQVQFKRAESGASGQTAVTEEDLRRFRFPRLDPTDVEERERHMAEALAQVDADRARLLQQETDAWSDFAEAVAGE